MSNLAKIVLEFDEVAHSPMRFDDPEADYERRYVRPVELVEEAEALGADAFEGMSDYLLAAEQVPSGAETHLQMRPFLCEVVGKLAADHEHSALKVLLKGDLIDAQRVVAAIDAKDRATTLAGWFLRRSRRAGVADSSKDAALREFFLQQLKALGPLHAQVKAAALEDPDDSVKALAGP